MLEVFLVPSFFFLKGMNQMSKRLPELAPLHPRNHEVWRGIRRPKFAQNREQH